jgi:hypothetical protein
MDIRRAKLLDPADVIVPDMEPKLFGASVGIERGGLLDCGIRLHFSHRVLGELT